MCLPKPVPFCRDTHTPPNSAAVVMTLGMTAGHHILTQEALSAQEEISERARRQTLDRHLQKQSLSRRSSWFLPPPAPHHRPKNLERWESSHSNKLCHAPMNLYGELLQAHSCRHSESWSSGNAQTQHRELQCNYN